MPEFKKTRLKKIGGLWRIKDGLRGNIDLGIFGKKQIVILKNKNKLQVSDRLQASINKKPDYFLYFDTGEEIKQTQQPKQTPKQPEL